MVVESCHPEGKAKVSLLTALMLAMSYTRNSEMQNTTHGCGKKVSKVQTSSCESSVTCDTSRLTGLEDSSSDDDDEGDDSLGSTYRLTGSGRSVRCWLHQTTHLTLTTRE